MADFSIIAVFFVGLLGGVHCLGMCGSIVGIFTAQMPRRHGGVEPSDETTSHSTRPSKNAGQVAGYGAGGAASQLLPQSAGPAITSDLASVVDSPGRMTSSSISNVSQLPKGNAHWPFHLAYNGGRLASYMVAGALAGAIGQAGLLLRDAVPVQHLLFALSSLMLIALGLYLAGIWNMVRRIEQAGRVLWRYIQPLARGLLPVTTPARALLLGTLWGWLPCGLVYSVLVTALASGNAQSGALVMLAFGLGTLPNLLAIGLFWENIRRRAQSPRVRLAAGLLVAGFGVYGLIKVGYTFYLYGWAGSCHVAA